MDITRDVIKLDCTKGSYVYAVKANDGVTLIDTSFSGNGIKILDELRSLSIQPEDIRRILLTHGDTDHIGNAAFLAERCDCEVYASEDEIPYIMNENKAKGFRGVLSAFMKAKLPNSLVKLPEGTINGIEIIKTPGHTPGHVCFKYENVLLIGDLLRSGKGELTLSPAIFTWDKAKVMEACKGLDLDGIDWLCPAHGEPIRTNPAWANFEKRYLG